MLVYQRVCDVSSTNWAPLSIQNTNPMGLRSMSTLEAGDQQQLRARYRQRMERMESKLLRQRDRIEDLEVTQAHLQERRERT